MKPMRKAAASKPRHVITPRAQAQRPEALYPRHFAEPRESYEDANDALDQIDRCIERVLAAGGEFALRRRLAQALGPGSLIEGSEAV
jgi:hypothetical protein